MTHMDIAIPDDSFEVAKNMKATDRFEIAVVGTDPLNACLLPFRARRKNTHTFTIFNDENKPIAMWGVIPEKKNNQRGLVWFLSDESALSEIRFLRNQKRAFKWVACHYKFIWNFCTEEQKKTIRWLKYLGFVFNGTVRVVNNVKMLYFYYEPKKVQIEPIDDLCGPRWATRMNQKVDNSKNLY